MGTQYVGTVLGDNPIAYYRMNEASGLVLHDAADFGGTLDNGTINGSGVTYNQGGAIVSDADGALQFDGSAGYCTLPAAAKTDGFSAMSVEYWFYLTSVTFSSFPRTVTGSSGSSYDGFFDNNATAISFTLYNGTTNGQAKWTNTFVISTWHHVVGTYDGANIKLYVDGTLRATQAQTGTVGSTGLNPAIGKDAGFLGQFFPGRIDEVALYNYALTGTQVTNHYNAGIAKNTTINAIPTNSGTRIIQPEDINQAVNILHQPSGGQELGNYFLEEPCYQLAATASMYVTSLSRGTTPVSVTVDTSTQAMTGLTGTLPSTDTIKTGGFHVFGSAATGAQNNARCGGAYTIQY